MGSAGRPSLPYQRSQVTRHRAPRYGRVMYEFPATRSSGTVLPSPVNESSARTFFRLRLQAQGSFPFSSR